MEKVLNFVSAGQPNRNDYEREINKYKTLYAEVNKNIPFYVRMNMVLIDGVEVKQKFLQICDQIIEQLMKSIHAFIMKKNTEITKEIGGLLEGISYKADTPEKLVEIERNIEKIKVKEHNEIEANFSDLKQWLFMLYSYQYKPDEELKAMTNLADQVHTLISKVEREENRIKKDRDDLETKLRKNREEFSANIDSLYSQIESVKLFSGTFQQKEANALIDSLDKKV
jgi:dynein heavy chain